MRKITLSFLVLLLTMVTQGAWAQIYPISLSGSGTAEDPYLIGSSSNWNTFATYVSFESYTGKYYKLTADITVTKMAGLIDPSTTSDAMRAFKGTFDGDGHTITLNLNVTKYDDDTPAAPFAQLNGATIKNLNVTGSINTDGRRAASIASFVTENSTITNCTSSVNITSSRAADVDAGAFVGRVNANKTLTMSNCAFLGSITYSSSQGYEGGGLVGWLQGNTTANLTNCVFAPTSVSFNKTGDVQYKMFTNGESSSTTNLTNCFYNDVAAGNTNITTQGGGKLILTSITSNSDWENFSMIVNYGYDYSGKTVTLNSNVGTVTKVVGTKDKPFVGTFDGGGHTLTVNINVTGDNEFAPAAPFAAIGATIKNLSVAGSITTIGMRPASIASFVIGNSIITNCKSSVNITSSYGGSIEAGGFVGRVNENKSLTMSGCAFTGSIHFTNEYGSEGGGMVGYLQSNATANITNCLFAPTSVSFARDNYVGLFGTFVGNAVFGESRLVNCFYNSVANIEAITKEGTHMCSISAGSGVTSLTISGESTEYNVSGITGYKVGIKYNGVYYAGIEYEVPLTLSHSDPPSGKFFDQYKVAGGGSLLEQNETTAVLSMTDANQTIIAQYVSAEDVEGPWTLQDMKTHVCPNDGSSTSVSFNNMNNHTWNGTITPWKDGDGVGYTFEGSSPAWSTMGIFSTYTYAYAAVPYSSLKLTWTYQLRSKTTEHHSTTYLYARQGEYSDITDMEVDFTNYYKSQLGFMYLLDHFTNRKNNGKIEKGSEKTTVIEFDNLNGSETKPAVCHLLLAHVFASGDDPSTGLKEWGSFKSVSYSVSTTYRMIVSFDANGGSGSMSVQNIDGSKKLSPNCFYRNGYTFAGWAKTADGAVVYTDGQEVTVTSENKGPVTLYAVWTPGESSSVSREVGPWTLMEWRTMLCDLTANTTMAFNRMNNWCWGTLTAQNDEYGIGFTVTGTSSADKKNAVFSIYGMTQSVPAYAKCRMTWGYQIGSRNGRHDSRVQLFESPDFELLKSKDVDFMVGAGIGYYTDHRLSYLYNKSFENQPAYSPAGTCDIEFDNLDGNSETNMSTYLMLTHVSSSLSSLPNLNEQGLLKHLSRADNWTYRKIVSFDANGGGGTMVDQVIDNSGTLTANTFTREGYTFAGWATAPNGAVGYTDGQEVTATSEDKGPVTLYAVWTPIAYTLSYELNGGAATNPATYTTTETLTLTAPTKEDYTFVGWTGANGTVPQTSVAIIKGSTGEKTFTAHWMSNAVSATVAQINAIGEVTYPTSGTAITAARTSYDALSEADQALVANYGTLTAAEQTYDAARDAAGSKTIRFVNKNNETITEQSVGMNLEAPVIPGFTFDHWQVVEKNISADQTIRLQAVYTSNNSQNSAPKVYANPANPAQKLVRQGDVYILQDKEN